MSLAEYQKDLEICCRCSCCKFIPLEQIKGYQHAYACPSIAKYQFNAYSGGGRLNMALAMVENKINDDNKYAEIVYDCLMCGACDVACKYGMDMEVLEPLNEMRIKMVEEGQTLPALEKQIDMLRKTSSMVPVKDIKRDQWIKNSGIKADLNPNAKLHFHAGCRTCYDPEQWKNATTILKLLKKAGVNVSAAGDKEICCGGRAYQMGYKEDFMRQMEENMEQMQKSGTEILLTGCADCYHAFKVLYRKFNPEWKLEVLHLTEYLSRLLHNGSLKTVRPVPYRITFQDPCHLGRQGEPFIQWEGKPIPGQIRRFDPPKEFRRGTHGVYDAPRIVLDSIPGLKILEMDRTREYAWCCGAGGGVKQSNPEFAEWTARERINEALSTGAEAIVTACPGCEKHFKDTISKSGIKLKVYDVVELLDQAI